jgi:hypothetical protein
MKKVKIDWADTLSPINKIYENTGVKFSWLASKEKGVFSQITDWHDCRETFAGEICRFVSTTTPSRWPYKRKMDLKKTRIAVTRRHNKGAFLDATKGDLKWMTCSAHILNIFEKTQGWALTRVSMCDDLNLYKNSINTFIFVGSVKWMQAPPLLSLYLLIIRLGRFWKEFSEFNKTDDLEKITTLLKIKDPKNTTDISWLDRTWKYWMPILNNHNVLFFNRSIEENYKIYTGSQGIKYLTDGYGDQETRDLWKKIVRTEVNKLKGDK